jgi:uncharacterized protein YqjF (DUF2071 family)
MLRRFLTAEWRDLLLLNYEVEPRLLTPLVPAGTELDPWDGRALVSLVGFRFLRTAVLGVPVPGHRDFAEVNLRFYVLRRTAGGLSRRGVVFIRELVPRRLVAWIARLVYNEPYRRVPMTHTVELAGRTPGEPGRVAYGWSHGTRPCRLSGELHAPLLPLRRPSESEFVTEHYWGYSRQRDGRTLEYEVRHTPWQVTDLTNPRFEGDATALFGAEFAKALAGPPRSSFFADGSAVVVLRGRRMTGGGGAARA